LNREFQEIGRYFWRQIGESYHLLGTCLGLGVGR